MRLAARSVVNFYIVSNSRRIESRSQSYDPELQRQRCKKLQRNYLVALFVFRIKINCSPAYCNAGVVFVISTVVGLGPGL
jgi:hypothetical protein